MQNTNPPVQQILDALVDTSLGNISVTLPHTVTAGANYQVNLVQDSENLNSILAQSNKFTIATASVSSSITSNTAFVALYVTCQ